MFLILNGQSPFSLHIYILQYLTNQYGSLVTKNIVKTQTDCLIPFIIRVESSNQSVKLACVYTILLLTCADNQNQTHLVVVNTCNDVMWSGIAVNVDEWNGTTEESSRTVLLGEWNRQWVARKKNQLHILLAQRVFSATILINTFK